MSAIRVLHLITTLDRGGAENALLHLCRALQDPKLDPSAAEHPVRVSVGYLKGEGELTPEFEAAGIDVQRLSLEGLQGVGAFSRARTLLRDTRPHIVHTHLFKADCLGAAVLRTRKPGDPELISTKHNEDAYLDGRGPLSQAVRAVAQRAAGRADAVIAISEGVAEHVRRRIPAAEARLRVIRYGVPEPPEAVGTPMKALRAQWNLPQRATVLLCPARFVEQKDHASLFEALARRQGTSPVRLVLLGRGPLEPELRRLAAPLGEQVIFAGFLENPDAAYCLCDAVVLSSRYEGLGLVLVEAAFRGRPSIATAVGGIPEVIQDGQTGVLVPAGDVDAMAAALNNVIENRSQASTLGRSARTFVRERFGLAARTADVRALYVELLAAAGTETSS